MTRTVAELDAYGYGRIVVWFEIAGYPYVYCTEDRTPRADDAWYYEDRDYGAGSSSVEAYDGVRPWLIPDALGDTEDLSRFIEGELEVPGIEVAVLDYDGELTAMLKDMAARTSSRINADVDDDDHTITLIDATGFPEPIDTAWMGLEAIRYVAKTATSLNTCARGIHKSTARSYLVDDTIEPPIGIMVTDGPIDIRGRPARIHMASVDDQGVAGVATCVYRGFVGMEIAEIGEGIWRIPVEHAWTSVCSKSLAQGLPSSDASMGYYYSGQSGGLSDITFSTYNRTTYQFDSYTVTIPEAFYPDADQLRSTIVSYVVAAGADLYFWVQESGEAPDKSLITVPADSDYEVHITIREGDPLWAVGFDAGELWQSPGVALSYESPNAVHLSVIDLHWSGSPRVPVENSAVFVEGCAVVLGKSSWALVNTIVGDSVYLHPYYRDYNRREQFWSVDADKADELVLRHVFAFSVIPGVIDTITTAMKRALHLLPGQSEPEEWCAFGLSSSDIDFDELDAAIAGAPTILRCFHDAISESVTFSDVFAPRLGLLGIAPRIIDDGVIGFARVETATALSAGSVEVDADMWGGGEDAARVRVSLGGDGVLSQVTVKFGHDYRDDSWSPSIDITWVDGISTYSRKRSISYDIRGMCVNPLIAGMPATRAELRTVLVPWTTALHYGIYGRLSSVVDLPCTWVAKQLLCGQFAAVTHELLPDVQNGTIGMTGRTALVEGRVQPRTSQRADILKLRFQSNNNASGISPAALGDGWTVGTLTMAFSGADDPVFAQDGGNDLAEFADGDDVLIWEYDTESPSSGYPLSATIDTVDAVAKTVVFTADPFSGSGIPGSYVVVTYPEWDDMTALQQRWLAIADGAYTIGRVTARWETCQTTVFSGTSPTTWTDMTDLPSIIGEISAIVLFYIKPLASSGALALRPNGDSDDWSNGSIEYGKGCAAIRFNVSVDESSAFMITDSAGLVEWIASGAVSMTVDAIGYIHSPSVAPTNVHSGTLSAGWHDIDASSVVGNRALLFLKVTANNGWAGGDNWISRPYGDSADFAISATYSYSATNKINEMDSGDAHGLVAVTDDTGTFQVYSSAATGDGDIDVIGYVEEGFGWNIPSSGVVFGPSATAPTSWTDLDLSGVVGSVRAFVLIKMHREDGTTSPQNVWVRENGTSQIVERGDYGVHACRMTNNKAALVLVSTDASGVIEWVSEVAASFTVEVVGYIPSLSGESPAKAAFEWGV